LISTVVIRTARNWGEYTPGNLDDLVQETFLKLCANDCHLLRTFRSQFPGALLGFLKVVTANVVHDHFKASRAAKRGAGNIVTNIEDHEQNEQIAKNALLHKPTSIEHDILLHEIDRCLAKLIAPNELSRSRRIFWLYYRCGFSARAISSLPDINLTTKGVESTLLRLNRLVRGAFGRPDETKTGANMFKSDSQLGEKGLSHPGSL
jgi:RNA polymerase sigma-70 factor (ECF subfamily)